MKVAESLQQKEGGYSRLETISQKDPLLNQLETIQGK